ncbi:ACT domain-containing protein ACR6 [Citrus sinensis]|uniref:ACT domain-containing protein ACR6 n=1 Tax=Citrus sinensis TaxID=2711 RepID=A0ACB8L9G1_CITSI|nr:ACT domain-containing protein ACR6 [Citrus sinensis]
MDDEFAKLIRRMNPPRVVIDNDVCEHATVIQVDSVNRHGILLEVIQFLVDLNLVITKAYISSDGGYLMDVFYVTDINGQKIGDQATISYIKTTVETNASFLNSMRSSVGVVPSKEYTSIELTGTDRPGLLSEVSAVLTDLSCSVVSAEIWTHNGRAAALLHVKDQSSGCAIEDQKRLLKIKKLLCNVLRTNGDLRTPSMSISSARVLHGERRLHQMLFADRDFERLDCVNYNSRPHVTILDCSDRDYTAVTIRSKDRPKLLFDTVCCLTDMQYVVYHGTVVTGRMEAYQEYYIKHVDGFPISSEAERQRVMACLEAAIERRASEGLELELYTDDRFGLLSDITRILREYGLCIRRAEISTMGRKAKDTFFVTDASGNPVDPKIVDSIQHQIGRTILQVKGNLNTPPKLPQEPARSFFFTNFFKGRSFQSFKLIKSCS